MQRLNYLFVQKHSPSEHVSVDESIIRFKGRTSLKQYNPMKPIRREYKLWCVADSDGYVYKFEVYAGKIFRKRSLLKILVYRQCCYQLIDWLQGKDHKVILDIFFSSVPLLKELKRKTILAYGTIPPNRKDLPVIADEKSLERGDFDLKCTSNGLSLY